MIKITHRTPMIWSPSDWDPFLICPSTDRMYGRKNLTSGVETTSALPALFSHIAQVVGPAGYPPS